MAQCLFGAAEIVREFSLLRQTWAIQRHVGAVLVGFLAGDHGYAPGCLTIGKVQFELTENPSYRVKMLMQHYLLVSMPRASAGEASCGLCRAGVERSRSRSAPRPTQGTVSPTQPYVILDEDNDDQDHHQDEQQNDQVEENVQEAPLRIRPPPPRDPRPVCLHILMIHVVHRRLFSLRSILLLRLTQLLALQCVPTGCRELGYMRTQMQALGRL